MLCMNINFSKVILTSELKHLVRLECIIYFSVTNSPQNTLSSNNKLLSFPSFCGSVLPMSVLIRLNMKYYICFRDDHVRV